MRRNATKHTKLALVAALCAVALPAQAMASDAGHATARARQLVRVQGAATLPGGSFGFTQGSNLLWESDADLAGDLDGMVAAGATWVGVDIDWPHIQYLGPDSWNWGPTDRVVSAAHERGLQVLGTIVYTPPWARPAGTTDKHAPTDPSAFATFAAAVVERYGAQGVRAYQIWNEPNTSQFWQPSPDPVAYTNLLIGAADAMHRIDPNVMVMNGGLAPAANVANTSITPNDFVLAMYEAGVAGRIDAISMHPYSFPFAPMTAAPWNPFYMLGYTHLIMSAYGDGALPIWGTESGFGTGRDKQSVNESLQATRMAQMVAAWKQYPFAGTLLVYGYRDLAAGSSVVWDNMGLVRHDFSAKPALNAFATAVRGPAPAAKTSGSCLRTGGLGPDRRGGC